MLDDDDSFGFRSILPASTFAASRGNEDGDGDVRVAQASAKLLADFLAAVGGGGAGTAAEDDPSQQQQQQAEKENEKGWSLPTDSLAALWDDVASAQFPAMTRHSSPLSSRRGARRV